MEKATPADLTAYPSHINAYDEETQRLERDGRRIACGLLIFQICVRILDFTTSLGPLLSMLTDSLVTVAMMASSLQQYYSTINVTNGGERLWDLNTMLWPTLLALATSLVSVVLTGIIVIAYFWGAKTADRWEGWRGKFNSFTSSIKTAFHTAVAEAFFSTAFNSTSLQGQTCNGPPAKQSLFSSELNFSSLCAMQVDHPTVYL